MLICRGLNSFSFCCFVGFFCCWSWLGLGITIPQAVLNDYELTISAHIVSDPEMSLFFNPFNKIPKNIPKNDRKKLIREPMH